MTDSEPAQRFGVPPHPQVRLVSRPASAPPHTWQGQAAELVAAAESSARSGVWRVTGVAGSGVTSLLVDALTARLGSGAPASSVCVIATSKESGGRLRRVLAERGVLS